MRRPEEQLHRAVAQLLRTAYPDLLWWTTPNQRGTRKRFEQAILAAMGVRAGVADICMVLPGGRFGAIELKAPGNYLSPPQRAFKDALLAAGGNWAMCRSLDEVVTVLGLWKAPTRLAA